MAAGTADSPEHRAHADFVSRESGLSCETHPNLPDCLARAFDVSGRGDLPGSPVRSDHELKEKRRQPEKGEKTECVGESGQENM